MKLIAEIEFHVNHSPQSDEHLTHLAQQELNRKINVNGFITVKVLGAEKSRRKYDDGDMHMVVHN